MAFAKNGRGVDRRILLGPLMGNLLVQFSPVLALVMLPLFQVEMRRTLCRRGGTASFMKERF